MIRSHAHHTAGANAVAARADVLATQAMHGTQGLGYGWPTVTSACAKDSNAVFSFMANTGTKRPPRRLGMRST